jgi:HAE1 family hydrophobic/amphiphilic exporter-1
MIEQSERSDGASVYAAKIKRKLESLVGAKVKQFP